MNDLFSIEMAAKKLGKTVESLQRWDKNGTLEAISSRFTVFKITKRPSRMH